MNGPSADYLPIEDHGAIGNLRTVALVGRDGAISWCPLPDLENASVFASILDHHRGGRFRVRPTGSTLGDQRYIDDTNVLQTIFEADGGQLVITDAMPLSGDLDGVGGTETEAEVHRLIHADGVEVDVEVEWSPRFRYGRDQPQIMGIDEGFLAWDGDHALTLVGLDDQEGEITDDGATLRGTFSLRAGERRALVTRWGPQPTTHRSPESSADVIDRAVEAWRAWVHKGEATGDRSWGAPHQSLIIRSELAIKLLSHGDTGAIAAAATTSLPEEIGGVRNWDYRYSWIRDAGLAAQALHSLGHGAEARAFVAWAEKSARAHQADDRSIQVVYGLHGETDIGEAELPHLEGYRRSAPVRVGNGAVDQLQLDIFGELIEAVYELIRQGEEVDEEILAFTSVVADDICQLWQEADYGLWEQRNGPFHYVYSKAMAWMGLDRAITLVKDGVIEGDAERWQASAERIRDEVLARGFDAGLGAFRQAYEKAELDASNLMLPLLEFLPFDDPRVQANLDATIEGLTENGLVMRYRSDDGIAGGEGAFGLCTFWLVDALAMSGRLEEARDLFEKMVGHANPLGLYSEEIDPETGAFLGNFPQAFSHIGLINSALYLAYAEGRPSPVPDPIGSPEHRAPKN